MVGEEEKGGCMSSGVMSPWAFFKSTVTKFCFGLGLATLSYYSFAEVKSWIDERHENAAKNRGTGLQEKINALTEGGAGSDPSVQMTGFPLTAPNAIPLPSVSNPQQSATGDVSVVAAGPEGIPSVNASPAASPDPAAAGAMESAQNPDNGEVVPNGGMEMTAPYAFPYAYDPGFVSGDPGLESSESGKGESPGLSQGSGAATGGASESFQGAAAPGMFAPRSNAQSSGSAPVNSNRIQPQDLPFLTTGLKAVFNAQPVGVISGGTQSTVHTSRWTPSEGLSPDLKFAIVGSNVNALTFQVGVNLQNASQTYALHTGVGSAVTASARNEFRNGQMFRVFEFRLSNISVRAGEVLRQIYVVLSFEAGSSANPVLGADSMISFVRTQVQMVSTPWNFNAPAANTDPVVTADQVNYSMPIERLP